MVKTYCAMGVVTCLLDAEADEARVRQTAGLEREAERPDAEERRAGSGIRRFYLVDGLISR
jgi:hypothetical protein